MRGSDLFDCSKYSTYSHYSPLLLLTGSEGRGQPVWHVNPIYFCIYHGKRRSEQKEYEFLTCLPLLKGSRKVEKGKRGERAGQNRTFYGTQTSDYGYWIIWVTLLFTDFLTAFRMPFTPIQFVSAKFWFNWNIFDMKFNLFALLLVSFVCVLEFSCNLFKF